MEEKYLEISGNVVNEEWNKDALWNYFEKFKELCPQPNGIWEGNLVLMWKKEHQRLIDAENW